MGTMRADVDHTTLPMACYVALVAVTLCGCSGTSGLTSLTNPISLGTLPAPDSILADKPPTDVYSVIAQKALVCWMGPKGPLKGSQIFHADAASPTTGGRAEIALHERDTTQKHPWGPRTFRIELTDEGGGTNTRIAMQNIKLPNDLAEALRTDVNAWVRGKDSCQAQVVRPPPPDPAPAPSKTKVKKTKPG
jgi:hypothetical protein